jgi:hypothetical protein
MEWVIGFIVVTIIAIAAVRAGARPKKNTKQQQTSRETTRRASDAGFAVRVPTDPPRARATLAVRSITESLTA